MAIKSDLKNHMPVFRGENFSYLRDSFFRPNQTQRIKIILSANAKTNA